MDVLAGLVNAMREDGPRNATDSRCREEVVV
jgi:hypothetical protein